MHFCRALLRPFTGTCDASGTGFDHIDTTQLDISVTLLFQRYPPGTAGDLPGCGNLPTTTKRRVEADHIDGQQTGQTAKPGGSEFLLPPGAAVIDPCKW